MHNFRLSLFIVKSLQKKLIICQYSLEIYEHIASLIYTYIDFDTYVVCCDGDMNATVGNQHDLVIDVDEA